MFNVFMFFFLFKLIVVGIIGFLLGFFLLGFFKVVCERLLRMI